MKNFWPVTFLTLLLGAQACGDEQLRRVQEELRKRNLYFGDIDGRKTNETTSAIRRYQARKGFSQTGEMDGSTLSSLNLAPPDPAITAWPDVPVLKSDAALPLSEKDRKFLETLPATDPVPIAEPPVDSERETALASTPPAESIPPANGVPREGPPVSNAPSTTKDLSSRKPEPPPPAADLVERFVRDYLAVCEANELEREMTFYADPLNYLNYGVVRRDFVKNDVRNYYQRWPDRDYKLLGLKVTRAKPGEAVVKFRIAFRVKNPQHSVSGKTDNTFTIRERGRALSFTSIKEQRIRD